MNDKLQYILDNAKKNSKYYCSRLTEKKKPCIDDFPVLTKEDLRNNCEDIVIDQYRFGDFSVLKSVFTSGSTGINTKVFWSTEDYLKSNISIWRLRKRWYGVSPKSKRVVFSSMKYNGRDLVQPKKVEVSQNDTVLSLSKFNLNEEDIVEYINIINEFEPFWISAQTSTLLRIIEVIKKNNIPFPKSIKYVELNGEVVSAGNLSYFKQYISVPIANLYGAMEVNAIAYECPYNSMHILDDNVFVESAIDDNQKEIILVTSLNNTVMPIIRYDIGDNVSFYKNKKCACGCSSPVIKEIKGRKTDVLALPDGRYINAYTIFYCIERVNLMLHNAIVQFKVIQINYNEIDIFLKISNNYHNWTDTIEEELRAVIEKDMQINKFNFKIIFLDSFDNESDLKFKVFESRVLQK